MTTTETSLVVEAELEDSPWVDHNGDKILDHNSAEILLDGLSWDVDFYKDVILPVDFEGGIRGGSSKDRVASPGRLEFALNNDSSNHHSTLGYYSTKHASARAGWGKKTRIKAGLQKSGGSVVWYFIGKVDQLRPDAGTYGERQVRVVAYDWLKEAQDDAGGRQITISEDIRASAAYAQVLAAASTQPEGTSFSESTIEMPLYGHMGTNANLKIFEELVKIATSNYEYLFLQGDGTLKSQNMTDRLSETTIYMTLDNDMIDLDASEEVQDIPRKFTATVYPATVGISTEIVAAIGESVRVGPGETVEFELDYRDPSGGRKMAAKDLETLVAGTHYNFSSNPDSDTGDLNSNLAVVVSEYAVRAGISATNNGNSVGWITLFELEGYTIRTLDQVSRSTEVSGAEGPEIKINLYYQSDPSFAASAVEMEKNVYTVDRAKTASGNAHTNETILDDFLDIIAQGAGVRVDLAEAVTGEDSEYFVNGHAFSFEHEQSISFELFLAPARSASPWIVGTTQVGVGKVLFSGG